jgi:hypothetical protein
MNLSKSCIISSALLGGVRGKKSTGGGSTRNQGANHKGKKRGMRCYDGQRVPINTLLAKQFKLDILPGWNTRFGFQGRYLPNLNISSNVLTHTFL